VFSLWLLPTRQESVALQAIIDRLAEENGAPRFLPHVTVFTGTCTRHDALPEWVAALAAEVPPFSLSVSGVRHSSYRMESVVIGFDMHASLTSLNRGMGARLGKAPSTSLNPHLSLIYKEMPAAQRSAMVPGLACEKEHIRMDRICVAAPIGNNWFCVESWQRFGECPLGRPAP
jgi:putative hydrolase of the HAD superfamily